MKSKFFALFIIFILFLSSCNNDNIVVTGKIDAEEETILKLYEIKVYSYKLIDSIEVKPSGKFKIKLQNDESAFYQLHAIRGVPINILAHPGDYINLSINTDEQSYTVNGNQENEILKVFNDSLRTLYSSIEELQEKYTNANATEKDSLEATYDQLLKNHRNYSLSLVLNNINSLICIPILYQEIQESQPLFDKSKDLQFFKIARDTLNKYYPNQRQVQALNTDFGNRMENFNRYQILSKANKSIIGLPDIKLPDVNGDSVSLFNMKSKYVLALFWSANNRRSIEEIQLFKKLYSKYNSKDFEILGINVGNSISEWEYAVQFEELPWINVIDTAFSTSSIRFIYDVKQLPENVLFTNGGKEVITRNLGAAKLDSYLQDVLQ